MSRFSTIHVLENTYSVPSRLIGAWVTVRLRAETVEVYVGTALACAMPRLSGRQRHAIDDHHVACNACVRCATVVRGKLLCRLRSSTSL